MNTNTYINAIEMDGKRVHEFVSRSGGVPGEVLRKERDAESVLIKKQSQN